MVNQARLTFRVVWTLGLDRIVVDWSALLGVAPARAIEGKGKPPRVELVEDEAFEDDDNEDEPDEAVA